MDEGLMDEMLCDLESMAGRAEDCLYLAGNDVILN